MRIFRHTALGWASIGGILGGGIVPSIAAIYYLGFSIPAGPELVMVWPASLGMMAIQPGTSPWVAASIWIVCASLNGALYGLVAASLFGIYSLITRGPA